jgi:hypothetical protein
VKKSFSKAPKIMLKKRKYIHEKIEIYIKSGKDSTNTLSLVIHGEIQKIPAKEYINIQGGKNSENHQF